MSESVPLEQTTSEDGSSRGGTCTNFVSSSSSMVITTSLSGVTGVLQDSVDESLKWAPATTPLAVLDSTVGFTVDEVDALIGETGDSATKTLEDAVLLTILSSSSKVWPEDEADDSLPLSSFSERLLESVGSFCGVVLKIVSAVGEDAGVGFVVTEDC